MGGAKHLVHSLGVGVVSQGDGAVASLLFKGEQTFFERYEVCRCLVKEPGEQIGGDFDVLAHDVPIGS